MLTLVGEQVECLWDELLPAEVKELPEDLARLDQVLSDSRLLLAIAQAWQAEARERGRKITDRLVSIADPDARPIRKGKLGKPTEFGYVAQICEVTGNTRPGARGFILPAGHAPATRRRTRCCRRPPPNWSAPGSARGRSSPSAASSPARPRTRSPN